MNEMTVVVSFAHTHTHARKRNRNSISFPKITATTETEKRPEEIILKTMLPQQKPREGIFIV